MRTASQTGVRLAELVQQQPFARAAGEQENLRPVFRGRAGEDGEQRQQALLVQPREHVVQHHRRAARTARRAAAAAPAAAEVGAVLRAGGEVVQTLLRGGFHGHPHPGIEQQAVVFPDGRRAEAFGRVFGQLGRDGAAHICGGLVHHGQRKLQRGEAAVGGAKRMLDGGHLPAQRRKVGRLRLERGLFPLGPTHNLVQRIDLLRVEANLAVHVGGRPRGRLRALGERAQPLDIHPVERLRPRAARAFVSGGERANLAGKVQQAVEQLGGAAVVLFAAVAPDAGGDARLHFTAPADALAVAGVQLVGAALL